jgi:hypothetical protein
LAPRYENEFFAIHDLDIRVVQVTRLPRVFASQEEVERACIPVQRTLDQLPRANFALLLDARQARGSNDPQHEEWFAAHRARMVKGFRRVAILMRTAIGALHSDRLTRSDGTRGDLLIFQDFDEACRHLGVRPKPPSVS